MEETLERMSGDRDLLANLFQLFMDDAPKKLSKIELYAEQGEYYQIERAAHSLKGAAATVGAAQLCQLAAELELAAKGRLLEQLAQLQRDLARVCDQTLTAMREFSASN